MEQHMRRREQNKKVHFGKTAQVKVLCARVSNGAHLGEEAAGHCELSRVDLKGPVVFFCRMETGGREKHCNMSRAEL